MKRFISGLAWTAGLALVAALSLFAAGWWWLQQPLVLASGDIEVSIEPGASPRETAKAWVDAGVHTSPALLYEWFRWSGDARRIRAGQIDKLHFPNRLHLKWQNAEQFSHHVR